MFMKKDSMKAGAGEQLKEAELITKLDQVVSEKKLHGRTEQLYRHWIGKFIRYSASHREIPREEDKVRPFLSELINRFQLSRARLNQAKQALEFYFNFVVERPLSH